jgi:hypothetical protein
MRHSFFVVAMLALSLCVVPAVAQVGSAALSGKVEDPGGLAVQDVSVQAINTDKNTIYRTTTNGDGIYSLSNLPPGDYRIVVEKEGFERLERPGVELHVADNISINFAIKVGSVVQTVEVKDAIPLVNITSGTLGGLVQANEVENLPLNGRNYIDLTMMQPGVAPINIPPGGAYNGTWFTTNGATPRSNNFLLDGAIMQDVNSGSTADFSGRTLGLDGIQEYRVITNNFSAEYGLTMGSQTIMVSKSGSNRFHGSGFEYLRNNMLDARNYFDKSIAANHFQRLPPYKRNNFGGSFGGPIQKDKTFFFVNYEQLEERLGITVNDTVPAAGCHGAAGAVITVAACPQLGSTASATIAPNIAPFLAIYPLPNLPNNGFTTPYSQPERDVFGQARVDHVFSTRDNAFVRYTIDDDEQDLALTFPQYFINPRLTRHQYATLSEDHVFSSSLLNSFRFSFSRTYSERTAANPFTGPQYSLVPGQPMGPITVGGLSGSLGPTANPGAIQHQNVLTLSDDVGKTFGSHSLKFGTLINSFRQFTRATQRIQGLMNFGSVATFLAGNALNFSAVAPGSDINRTWQFYTLGFYAQDDWRVRSNFTVNLGLRYEPSPNYYHEVNGISVALRNPLTDTALTVGPMFKNPTLNNFSPRLGFAWDVFGSGKTAIRGGASLMYDIGNLYNGLNTFVGAQPPFSAFQVGSGTFTLPLTFTSLSQAPSTVQYNLKQARLYTESFTVEQQLPLDAVLSVSYVGSRGVHLLNLGDANPDVPLGFSAPGVPFWDPNSAHVVARVNPAWNTVALYGSNGDSSYNAMEVVVTKRVTHGLQFQSSYTWAKLIDNQASEANTDCPETTTYASNPYNARFDRGPACFNIPHIWVSNFLYRIPSPRISERVLGALTRGWGLSGIYTFRDGLPFNPCDSANRSRSGLSGGVSPCIDRPNYNPAFTGNIITGGVAHYFNPAAFVLQPAGTLGNVGRNGLMGPSFNEFNFAVRKDIKLGFLGDGGGLEFRTEFFNLFNHPNFGLPSAGTFGGALTDPVTAAPLSNAGQITNTVGTSRQIEFSLRIAF